jgi:putative lipoprotein
VTGRSETLVSLSLVTALAAIAPRAAASDADPWFGRDKALHFGVSAAIASSGYALGTALFEPRWKAATFGGGLAIAAGAGKELADLAGLGDPSWRDFTWDLLGTAVGLGLAFAIDAVVRKDPAPATTGSKLVVQF